MTPIKWDGGVITKPGLYSHLSSADYHRHDLCDGPSISSTGLKTIISKGAMAFHRFWDGNPNRKVPKVTKEMLFGRAFHAAILEMKDFRKTFIMQPATYPDPKTGKAKPWSGNATWCKEWTEKALDDGLTILTADEVSQIRGMAKELAAHPLVRNGALNGLIEHALIYRDEETGIWIKTRPDVIPTSDLSIVDLKSIADISDKGISKAIGDYGMGQQGALVGEACKAVLDQEMTSFSLCFSQKEEPHEARIHTMIGEDLELGHRANRAALRTFARCLETGIWPGLGGIQTDAGYVSMQPYKRTEIERRLAILEAELSIFQA